MSNVNDASESTSNLLNVQAPVRGKVLLLVLADGLPVQNVGDNTMHTIEIGAVLHNAGPLIDDIIIHFHIEDMSPSFSVNLKGTKSYDAKNFTEFGPFWPVGSPLAAPGYHISAAYTTRTDFGLHIGFRLILPASQTIQSARISVKAALRLAT